MKKEKKESSKKKVSDLKNEREEALMRIVVLIVSGFILYLWGYAVVLMILVNFIYTLVSGKRLREIADFSEIWATNIYYFVRYVSFISNERPFPFKELKKSIGKFE